VASGKSTVARQLAGLLNGVHLGADEVRAAEPASGLATFSRSFEDRVYGDLLQRAEAALDQGRCVILDGCFARVEERERARRLAVRHGIPFVFVECCASEACIRQRLAARDARVGAGSTFWQETHDGVAARYEPVLELAPGQHAVLPTDGPAEPAAAEVAARLRALWRRRLLPAAVTFDCWNTLIYESDWELAHTLRVTRLREASEEAGRPVPPEEATRAFDAAWTRHMEGWRRGEASGAREIAHWGLAELGLHDPHPAFEHLVQAFEEASHTSELHAIEGARESLEALAHAGIPCALVCDTGLTPGRVVRRHLDRMGLLAGLAVQVFSDEVGVPKPDPKAFRAALEPLGVAPEHALHVGDLRRTDVAGARSLGMCSVRIRARHDDLEPLPEADFVVSSHAGLRELLELEGSRRNRRPTSASDPATETGDP